MPLYEYQCQSCGKKFEVLQKFSDAPLQIHEACGGKVEKLFSAPAFHLKGTGWYATDYAKGGASTPARNDEKSQEKTEGDSKPASTTESSASTETKATPAAESKPSPAPASDSK